MEKLYLIILLIGVLITIAPLLFFTVQFFKIRRDFNARGKRTMAKVIDAVSRGRRAAYIKHTYTLEYMAEGERQTTQFTVGVGHEHEVGETVEIAYLPEDPKRAMLTKDIADTTHGFIYIFACVLVLVISAIYVPAILAKF